MWSGYDYNIPMIYKQKAITTFDFFFTGDITEILLFTCKNLYSFE